MAEEETDHVPVAVVAPMNHLLSSISSTPSLSDIEDDTTESDSDNEGEYDVEAEQQELEEGVVRVRIEPTAVPETWLFPYRAPTQCQRVNQLRREAAVAGCLVGNVVTEKLPSCIRQVKLMYDSAKRLRDRLTMLKNAMRPEAETSKHCIVNFCIDLLMSNVVRLQQHAEEVKDEVLKAIGARPLDNDDAAAAVGAAASVMESVD